MVIDLGAVPLTAVEWPSAVRIIRSLYPPIDLFEDIADPADWPLIISAALKTIPRLMETIGNLDLVPPARRVAGPGASYLMAPFTHVSVDRPSRFSDGRSASSMPPIYSRSPSSRRRFIMADSWSALMNQPAGPHTFSRSYCHSPPSCTTFEVAIPSSVRRCSLMITRKAKSLGRASEMILPPTA